MLKSLDKWYHENETIYLKRKFGFMNCIVPDFDESDFDSKIIHSIRENINFPIYSQSIQHFPEYIPK